MRVFRAISREQVLEELHAWAVQERKAHPEISRIGLFGSYAKGAFAPGSDIDLLILVSESSEPRWFMRSAGFDTLKLSVGADLFVYTEAEAERMRETSSWFQHILREVVWIE